MCTAIWAANPADGARRFSHVHQSVCLWQTCLGGALFPAVVPQASHLGGEIGKLHMTYMGHFYLLKHVFNVEKLIPTH